MAGQLALSHLLFQDSEAHLGMATRRVLWSPHPEY